MISRIRLQSSILLAVLLVLLGSGPGFAKFDPAFTWTTLETPHFLIHYHQGGEETAQRAARIAEDVHARLVPRIKWEPEAKTRLVLVDAMDESNGWAAPIPYNRIIVFLTQPAGEPGSGAASYDDWLRLVITHEYTHILQLDMVTGGPKTVQSVLGRIYFPNMFQPLWMIEGLATYEETEQTSGGRGRAPGVEMILRMAVLEDRMPDLGRMSVLQDSWPSGQVPYLFGESFMRYIADKYGRDKLAELSAAYSGRKAPFLVTSTGKRVLNERYDDLYDEWNAALKARYEKQRDLTQAAGLTASKALTGRGYQNLYPAFSPDGTRIAYLIADKDGFPGIGMMNVDGSGDRKIVENVFPVSTSGSGPAWAPDGKGVYYTKIEIRGANYFSDIYYYDLGRGRELRLTKGLRARDPHPSPDGKSLVFVVNRLGGTRLATMNILPGRRPPAREKEVAYLTQPGAVLYSSPRFSPDSGMIAVGAWQPGGFKDIWLHDAHGNKIAELSHDRALDGAPAWDRDGKYIYYSSDRTGIFNLFAYELASKKTYQITNVLGGLFSPSASPDGRSLVFSSYSSKGYDIHTLGIGAASWKEVAPYRDPYPVMTYDDKPVETITRPYSPLSTLYPRFWLPWFGVNDKSGVLGGFLTFGQDAVQRHEYLITGLYGPKYNRAWYGLDYFYDGFPPTIRFHASDTDVTYPDLLADSTAVADYTEKQKTFGVSMIAPLLKVASQHIITIGYQWREINRFDELQPWPGYGGAAPAEGVLASGRLSYLFNSARIYGFSISPEEGRRIELGYERLDQSLGSDFELNKYTADWQEYINFPWKHHVLQARAFAGTSTGDLVSQRAFQLGGDNPGDITLSLDDRNVHLQGYPANSFRGQNAGLASLEYRFPIRELERGWNTKPVFFRRAHGAVFYAAGNAWDGTFHGSDLKRSVGAELRLDAYLSYFLPVTFRFVFAKGLDEKGEATSYFGLWVPLEL